MAARPLAVNAAELLREPGLVRVVETTVPLAELDVHDGRVHGDVAVDVALTSTLDDIEVVGRLTVEWADACRRCLRPIHGPLVIDVDERYAPPATDPGRRRDPDAFPIDHGQLDLTPLVRDGVLLGLPDAPLCRADCPGLCPVCGAEKSAGPCGCDPVGRDERWAALDQLRDP